MKTTLFLTLLLGTWAGAADKKYPVSAIPAELKNEVNAVVREDKTLFTIQAKDKALLACKFVVTILNSKGNHFAEKSFGYDKLMKITSLKAQVYDAAGEVIKKLKQSEIHDQSAYDGFSLYSDFRLKTVDLTQAVYPYTVEFEYEIEYKYLYSVPGTTLLPAKKTAVQLVEYKLIFPPGLRPRYKLKNIDQEPHVEKISTETEALYWTFTNILPIKEEPLGPGWDDLVPEILAGPSVFDYDGFSGNMSSWQEFGKWQLQLNQGRDVLSDATRKKVAEITKGLPSNEEKVKALYEYLQGKTRYVSIQDGIGGLQPFAASVVEETSYGDCKALSNFMIALLKEAGIKGYYAKIRAGRGEADILPDFPSHQTNHIIVAVPNQADTLWLECTSQTNPFGYLGHFTGDRTAILVAEDGGKVVRTPRYPTDVNRQIRTAEVFLETTGDAKAKVSTTYSGLQYENGNLSEYLGSSQEEKKKWIQNNTDIPSFDLGAFSFIQRKNKIPEAIVDTEFTMKRFASVSGKRLFLTPNLMNRSTFIPEKVENRKTNVIRKFPYLDIDTIRYRMPDALYPEFLPAPVQFKSRFGEYESSTQMDKGDVIYIRKVKMFKGEFPPESYQELIDFYKYMNKADNVKLVFLNKT